MGEDKIKWLSKLTKKDANSVGDKAANLGEIFQEKFIVPQGFVITNEAFELILKENGIKDEIISLLKSAQPQDLHDIKSKSQEVQKLILNSKIPPELEEEILESYDNLNTDLSGLEDAPGALAILKSAREPIFVSIRASTEEDERLGRKTFTNIRGNREVIDKVKICLAHMFSEEAIKMRKEKSKSEFQPISIIIQKMINSEKSGVVYSSGKSGYKVEAIFGQGCTIPGKIEPDRYELNGDFEIINEKVSNKKLAIIRTAGGQTKFVELPEEKSISRVLRAFEIKQICEIASKIEAHYDFPQEIEFAIDESSICILQTKELAIKEEEKTAEVIPNEIIEQTRTKIRSEVDCPKEDVLAKQIGINEIGLIKLEKIIARNGKHPIKYKQENSLHEYQERIEQDLGKIINGQNRVWIKLSEFRQDKYPELPGSPQTQENPMISSTGIDFLLKNLELLKSELLAIKNIKDSGKNVGIIIPKATSTDELQRVWDLIDQMGMNYVEVGACIDTPASAILIREFIEYGMKHIMISLDDLIEYTMASSISNRDILDESKNNMQALTKLISRIIREARANSIETSVLGKSLSNQKILAPILRKKIGSAILRPKLAKSISAKIKFLEESIQNNL